MGHSNTESPELHVRGPDEDVKPKRWYAYFWDTLDKPKEERWFLFKLDAFLLSVAALSYFTKFLDQINIGNAYVSGMREDLNLYGNQLNYMQTCWTVGYIVGGVPSNIILTKFRPSIWLPILEVTWGVLTFCTASAKNVTALYALRFFVGLAEAGFYPGIQYIIGSWYRKEELAKRSSLFHISSALGAMFSGYLMAAVYHLGGVGGHKGWQWLFIVDGIITLPIAIAGFFVFPDVPEIAKPFYLTKDEVKLAQKRMQLEGREQRQPYTKAKVWKILSSWHIYLLTFTYLCMGISNASGNSQFALFLKFSKHPKYTVSQINVYPTTTYACQIIATLLFAWTSDGLLKGARWPAIAAGSLVNIIVNSSFVAWDINIKWKWACFILTGAGIGTSPLFMAWAHEICTFDNEERAVVIATMNQFVYVVTAWLPLLVWKVTDAPRFHKGYSTALGFSALPIVFALIIRVLHAREVARKRSHEEAGISQDSSEDGSVRAKHDGVVEKTVEL